MERIPNARVQIGSIRAEARQKGAGDPSRRDALSSLLSYTAGAATLATTTSARASISATDSPPARSADMFGM